MFSNKQEFIYKHFEPVLRLNAPPLSANPMILGSLMIHTFTVTVHPQKRGKKTV